jgi:hypothetical protein
MIPTDLAHGDKELSTQKRSGGAEDFGAELWPEEGHFAKAG